MKAIVQDAYGTGEVLHVEETGTPAPAADEVLVKVHAAGVDPGVWHLTTGRPYMVRLMGFGLRAPKSRVPGMAFAGQVEAMGSAVTGFTIGDRVFGAGTGTFAEYARAKAATIAVIPESVTYEQAAAAPVSAVTALQGLRDAGHLMAGQRVLIIGAGGGVGSFAVQIAKHTGAHVTGVCRTAKVDLVRSLGADDVIDYTTHEITGGPYDLILDTAGNRSLSVLRRLLTKHGTLVLVGGEGGDSIFGGFDRQLRAALLSPVVGQTLKPLMAKDSTADLRTIAELMSTGAIASVIDRTFPLGQAAEAIDYVHAAGPAGKVVLTV